MEYQKVINFLDDTPNEPCKLTTKYLVEVNVDSRGASIVKSNLKLQ